METLPKTTSRQNGLQLGKTIIVKQSCKRRKPASLWQSSWVTGKTGWETIAKDGKIDEQAAKLLNSKFVCVYIDAETSSGHKLAEAFEVKNKGLVISDRTGNSQAFSHTGDLSQTDLTKALEKYSDANRVVLSTESVEEVAPPPAPKTYQQGTIRYYGTAPASTCPNCR